MSSNLKVNTILPSSGSAIGIGTASGNVDVLGHIVGHNTPNISGINSVTASHFYGDGSNLTGISAGTSLSGSTNNTVCTVTGANAIQGESTLTYDGTNLDLGDGKYIRLGASNDFQMWHNGGTGNTNIKQVTGHMYFYTGSDLNMLIRDGTSVDLYYANNKKFETVTGGVQVTGAYELEAASGQPNPTIDNADGGQKRSLYFKTGGSARLIIQDDGHTRPASNNTFDLGTTSDRWRNIYTNDLNLSNKGSTNSVDDTWGDYTIQEGESDLFLINNRNGKKYKFNLTEVS